MNLIQWRRALEEAGLGRVACPRRPTVRRQLSDARSQTRWCATCCEWRHNKLSPSGRSSVLVRPLHLLEPTKSSTQIASRETKRCKCLPATDSDAHSARKHTRSAPVADPRDSLGSQFNWQRLFSLNGLQSKEFGQPLDGDLLGFELAPS